MHQHSPGVAVVLERCTEEGCGVSWVECLQKRQGRSKVDTNNVLYRVEEGFFNHVYTGLKATDAGRKSQGDGAVTRRRMRQIEDEILTILIEMKKKACCLKQNILYLEHIPTSQTT